MTLDAVLNVIASGCGCGGGGQDALLSVADNSAQEAVPEIITFTRYHCQPRPFLLTFTECSMDVSLKRPCLQITIRNFRFMLKER